MKLTQFSTELDKKLKSQIISSRILLDKLRLMDDSSRKSGQYQDPMYLPFYFHLSKFSTPKSILQIGLNLGLEICCYLQGNKNVDDFFAFQNSNGDFFSERLAFSNIRDISKKIKINYYYGKIFDKKFLDSLSKVDLAIINEKSNFDQIKDSLSVCWDYLNLDGLLVLDYLNYDKKIKKMFLDFCKVQNREGVIFDTRYGTGIIQR